MTKAQNEILSLLARSNVPLPTGYIGERLWGNGVRMPQHYARPAGRILKRMQDCGLVLRSFRGGKRFDGWVISEFGKTVQGD